MEYWGYEEVFANAFGKDGIAVGEKILVWWVVEMGPMDETGKIDHCHCSLYIFIPWQYLQLYSDIRFGIIFSSCFNESRYMNPISQDIVIPLIYAPVVGCTSRPPGPRSLMDISSVIEPVGSGIGLVQNLVRNKAIIRRTRSIK